MDTPRSARLVRSFICLLLCGCACAVSLSPAINSQECGTKPVHQVCCSASLGLCFDMSCKYSGRPRAGCDVVQLPEVIRLPVTAAALHLKIMATILLSLSILNVR